MKTREEIVAILSDLINPVTKSTFQSENRSLNVKVQGDKIEIEYDRDGISPEDKRVIENQIVKLLTPFISEDNIFISTSSKNSSDVYKALNNAGHAPKDKNDSSAPAQIKAGHATVGTKKKISNIKKVIAVSSAKGGVGKSTVSVNLAYSLKKLGRKVGLLDADIYGPSIPMLLNKRSEKPKATDDKKIVPIVADGLPFISFGLFIGESEPVIWRGPMLGGVLNQFLFDVDWGELDYLVIDLPPGTGDMQLSLVQSLEVDGVVVVSTPQDVALLDSKKGLKMFQQVKTPIIGMIENMSTFICDSCDKHHDIFGKGGVTKAAKELNIDFLGEIPLETSLRICSDIGTPFMSMSQNEGKESWKAYMNIAKKVDAKFDSDDRNKGIFKNLFKR